MSALERLLIQLPDDRLADLVDDGDVVDVADGLRLRLTIEPDMVACVSDYDCYGLVAEAEYCSGERPAGFDGRARKLSYGNYGPWWWQPPADALEENLDSEAHHMAELLAFGFSCVGVILEERFEDRYDQEQWIEVQASFLGGVDSDDSAYLNECARDMAWELGAR